MKINVGKLLRNDKSIMLACDQGMEHGPQDFNLTNIDPNYIFDIALEGRYNAVIVQSGIAEKYYHDAYRDVPLVVKINGKTSIPHVDPISRQICSVDRAIKLGGDAIGYTVFDGSPKESEIFSEFGKVVEQAHDYGIPVIAWMYPRGPFVKDDLDPHILAYSARVGLELGADFVKMKYPGDAGAFNWMVKNAGRARMLAAGGDKGSPSDFLNMASNVIANGGTGLAVGRNIWQSDKPFAMTHALRDVVFRNKKVEEVLSYFEDEK